MTEKQRDKLYLFNITILFVTILVNVINFLLRCIFYYLKHYV
jgi:hypothetical protein